MIVPTKKLSKSRTRKRRYQKEKVDKIQLQPCKNCGALTLAHRVCAHCGFYRGKFYSVLKKEKKEN